MKFLEYYNILKENKSISVSRLWQELNVVTQFKYLNRVHVPETEAANIIIISIAGVISKSGAIYCEFAFFEGITGGPTAGE